jgi:hypothetical protein
LDEKIDAGRVAAWSRQAGDKTNLDRVFANAETRSGSSRSQLWLRSRN